MNLFLNIVLLLSLLIGCAAQQKVNSNNSKFNELTTKQVIDPSFYQEKFLGGIDFYARGNEPNWVLEIDFDSSMKFSEMNGLSIITPSVKGIKAQDADVTNFRAQTESGDLSVTISKVKCQDNMSGEMFDYNVRVQIRKGLETEFIEFTGCGKYLYDYRLHDIWAMEEMTGVELKKENLMKGLPMFEFNLSEMRFSGHAGCNQILGAIDLKGNKITFGNLISTKMACPDMTVEEKVGQLLNNNTLSYRIEKLKLVLESDSGTRMIFKKID
ncbi:MAG: META domain-containing protein [Ignavibacterium sp.]|jgi:heat shock protein HslJ/uncharacterized membrane protein|uniref:META domain-containing protein n=1 Tax=Ignavibacterium sp. TaxID=2651167 RepID=UPI0032999049